MKKKKDNKKKEITNKYFQPKLWHFIICPLLVIFTVTSFLFVTFTILPLINNIGIAAFGQDSEMLLSYGIMPFLCIDMCIMQGYFYCIKKVLRKTLNYFNNRGKEE